MSAALAVPEPAAALCALDELIHAAATAPATRARAAELADEIRRTRTQSDGLERMRLDALANLTDLCALAGALRETLH